MTGRVYLVGAGPGDAGLLTTHGRRLLAAADAVVYDRLISPRLLDLVPKSAERLYVGKSAGHHALSQEAIQSTLVELAHRCKTVVRLKGGDPFVFGRGSEEAQWLQRHGVTYEVVPGVTSAISVPAYAGIPLTARGISGGFAVITGQSGDLTIPDVTSSVDLLLQGGTLVVLMGMGNLREIASTLTSRGVPENLPTAAVQWGTRARQRSVHATLDTIANSVDAERLSAPAVIVIGQTAGLHAELAWVTARPLFGRRLVVAVETEQEARLAGEEMESLGAEFVTFVAEREAVVDESAIARDLADAIRRDTHTSRRLSFSTALDAVLFLRRFAEKYRDLRHLAGVTLVATGSAAHVLSSHGLVPDEQLAAPPSPARYAKDFSLPQHVADTLWGDEAVEAVWASSESAWLSLVQASRSRESSLPRRFDLEEQIAQHRAVVSDALASIQLADSGRCRWSETAPASVG